MLTRFGLSSVCAGEGRGCGGGPRLPSLLRSPLKAQKGRMALSLNPLPRTSSWDGRRASDEGRDSLQGSPRACGQAGPRTQTLMGSHGVPSPTEGQDLAEQREGGCSVPAQTETNSKPPSDKAKGLTSWQTEACSAWCPDIFSQRANPHGWPPPASGLRAQPSMIAREVPLRLAKTAVRSQLKGGCLQSALFPTYGACGHVSPHCRPPIFSLLPSLPTRPISVGNRGTASEL